MSASKINLSEPPQFLSILGSQGFNFDSAKGVAEMKFEIGEELTHSNGTIVQGGFITAMLDASMKEALQVSVSSMETSCHVHHGLPLCSCRLSLKPIHSNQYQPLGD